jgi:peptidoglycan/LPS O-acetylase OafA/YrhL
LITTIIASGLRQRHFSFADFYARRARRIFPALIAVLLFCYAAGWFLLLSDEFAALNRQIAAGAGFVSNLQLWSESGYFDRAAESKPLLHLWSLGIEEQFYLFWPLALALAFSRRLPLFWLIVVIAIASFAMDVSLIGRDPVATFYSPLTRVWELAAGGMLAYAFLEPRPPAVAKLPANLLSFAGAGLIVAALALLDKTAPFPGWWALLPVAGTALLIAAGPLPWLNRFALGNPVMVGIGLISYPLYLWHWPLLTFLRLGSPWVLGTGSRLAVIAASIIAATATYLLLERPLRPRGSVWKTPVLALLIVICGLIGLAADLGDWPSRHTEPSLTRIINASHDWGYPPPTFHGIYRHGHRFYGRKSGLASTTLFLGDSNMEQYAPRIEALIAARPASVNSAIFATRGGCLAIPSFIEQADFLCRRTMRAAFMLAADPEVDTIVVAGGWAGLANETTGPVHLASLQAMMTEWARTKRVFLILSMPHGREFDPKNMFDGSRLTQLHARKTESAVALADILQRQQGVRAGVIAAAQASGAIVIDPLPALCSEGVCPALAADGEPLYLDAGHMRPFHVTAQARYLDVTLQPATSPRP